MDCVVGSGPSGVACTAALLKRGRRVLMLDGGLSLESDRRLTVSNLSRLPPEQWTDEQVRWLASDTGHYADGYPKKLLFNSDYFYREVEQHLGVSTQTVGLKASLAVGGLSTVWGAAMLPYCEREVADWPITFQQLMRHYEASTQLTGLSANCDDLNEVFPVFTNSVGHLEPSLQASAMWRCLSRNRERLRAAGILHGQARLAIRAAQGGETGCV